MLQSNFKKDEKVCLQSCVSDVFQLWMNLRDLEKDSFRSIFFSCDSTIDYPSLFEAICSALCQFRTWDSLKFFQDSWLFHRVDPDGFQSTFMDLDRFWWLLCDVWGFFGDFRLFSSLLLFLFWRFFWYYWLLGALSGARYGAKMADAAAADLSCVFFFLFCFHLGFFFYPPAKRLKMRKRGHQRAQYVARHYFNKVLFVLFFYLFMSFGVGFWLSLIDIFRGSVAIPHAISHASNPSGGSKSERTPTDANELELLVIT